MKRNKYVDDNGETINYGFESKKPILTILFVIGTVVPLILVGFIIYTVICNNYCHNIYKKIETASYNYLKNTKKLPKYAGDNITVKMDDLYSHSYLNKVDTADKKVTGNVKVTKYKKEYIYTLNINNCGKCSIKTRYGKWSSETSLYKNKWIVDVIPYFNVYDRQVGMSQWSRMYDDDELEKKSSKYKVRLPKEEELPEIPEGSNIMDVETEEVTYYRYSDKSWKWYDIVGDYSDFYSERPNGFTNKDEDTLKYTEYTDYSLDYPEEYDYRTIKSQTGYKFYYIDDSGKKIYANSGKYAIEEDVDQSVYNERDDKSATMYSYSDKTWRWYNGQKRSYSSYKSLKPDGYNYKDEDLYSLDDFSSWNVYSYLTEDSKSYRTEEEKVMTRFRIKYEILSLKVFNDALKKDEFENAMNKKIKNIRKDETYKLEVNYKFRYKNVK